MESIASLKNVATRAIWGDEQAHQEPISGETGDVSKGEPYDAGNMGESELRPSPQPEPLLSSPAPDPEEAQAKFAAPDETGTQPVEAAKTTAPDTESEPGLGVNASEIKDSSAAKGDSTKGQNDVRDPSDPSSRHGEAEAKTNVDDSGAGLDLDKNPDKVDGPGPRPIEEVAREHGGNAGKSGSDDSIARQSDGKSSDEDQDRHDGGTGELYVRSSGLKADGGDFDAAAPGAGREADRLMEEKGLHPSGHANGHADGDANDTAHHNHHHKEKTSLKNKIKAKLHRHSATPSS